MDHTRFAASRDLAPLHDDRRFAGARAARMTARLPRVNVLVVGPDEAVEDVLAAVRRETKPDVESGGDPLVAVWRPGRPFVLPRPATTQTMILRDVDTLVHGDQHQLVAWLEEAAGRVQVVSTASSSLMPLVDAGVFMQTLYYRLNTIYLDLTERRFATGDW